MPAPEPSARFSLIRGLVFYSALLVADLAVIAYVLNVGVGGAGYLTLAVIAVIGLLLLYQVWTHALDLRAPLIETEGIVERKWSRADLIIVWHSYYLTVEHRVFKVDPRDYVMIDEAMPVKVVHFPRTLNVVSVEEVRHQKQPSTPG